MLKQTGMRLATGMATLSTLALLVLLAGALLTAAPLAGAQRSPTKGQTQVLPKDEVALQVADALDSIIQPRFQNDAGKFGVGRLVTVDGHVFVADLEAADPAEAAVLAKAKAYQRDYLIAFLHTTHVPGKFTRGGLSPQPQFKPYLSTLAGSGFGRRDLSSAAVYFRGQALQPAVVAAFPRLADGAVAPFMVDNQWVFLRPVRALQSSCLDCHTGAKKGDTLGVMVYAVSSASNANGVNTASDKTTAAEK